MRTLLGVVLCALAGADKIRPFHRSAYYAREPLPSFFGLIERVDNVIAARSYKGEIIVAAVTSDSIWQRWAVHFFNMLTHVGYQHWVALGADEHACELLRDAWPNPSTWGGCGWLPDNVHESVFLAERLWMQRYLFTANLLDAGVNVALLDLDVVIHKDLYAVPKSMPDVHLFQMADSELANGGCLYAQGTTPGGPMSTAFREVWRRGNLIASVPNLKFMCSNVDQDILRAIHNTLAHNVTLNHWPCLERDIPGVGERLPDGVHVGFRFNDRRQRLHLGGVTETVAMPRDFLEDTNDNRAFNRGWTDPDYPDAASTATHLVAFFGRYNSTSEKFNRAHVLQARNMWYGPPIRATAYVMWDARMTYASFEELDTHIKLLVNAGAVLGRKPILPEVPCTSPWIARDAGARFGVYDARYVPTAFGCAPMMSVSCSDDHVWSAFDFRNEKPGDVLVLDAWVPRKPETPSPCVEWLI